MQDVDDTGDARASGPGDEETAALGLVTAALRLRVEPTGNEQSHVSVPVDRGHGDLATRVREMEETAPRESGFTVDIHQWGQGADPSFVDLRRAIDEELHDGDEGDDALDHRLRDVEDMRTAIMVAENAPYRRSYHDDEGDTGEAAAIDAHAYRTRVRIVLLIQVGTAVACGLLALLHVTGRI